MKKLFGALVAAVMMAAGLVTFAMSPASAACPYSGCVPTSTTIIGPGQVEKGSRARICVRVDAASGNADPKGQVSINVVRSNGGFRFVDSKEYSGGRECFRTPVLEKIGKYVIEAKFDKKPGSRWLDSDNRDSFRVVR